MTTSGKDKKTAIFIDAANYHYALKDAGWKIDYLKFVNYFKSQFNVVKVFYYEGYPTKRMYLINHPKDSSGESEKQKQRKMNYFRFLKQHGITVRTKPVACMYDKAEDKYTFKCNFDVELTIDAIDSINEYDQILLCTGDGDFAKLISYLKGKFKRVYLVSMRDRCSSFLKQAKPHQIIWLEKLKPNVCWQKEKPSRS